MPNRVEQVSVRRKPVRPGGLLRNCPHTIRVVALTVLLVVASLTFATAASIGQAAAAPTAVGTGVARGEPSSKQARVVALLQDTPEAPEDTPTGEPEPTAEPPGETAEPAPSETPEPPTETTRPTPGEPSEPEATPEPEVTVGPSATEPATVAETATATATASATALATPTVTPAVSIWPTDWPLGTVRFGAEEPGPPAEPIRVMMEEWIRLALALVIVTLVAIFGGRVLFRLLGSVLKRQHLDVDGTLLIQLKPLLSWWLAAIGFHVTVWWVDFQNERARDLSMDLAFLAYVGVATLTAWRLVDLGIDLYTRRMIAEGHAATVEKLRPVLRRWARVLILLFSTLVALGRLDVGFSVPTILVLLIGLAISLAARDILTDIIAGFFILIDQPFRIGDRIEVQGVDTWAEVVNIGLRTSVLRTRHNVEIIVPNSTIGKGQVINYSYPDPRYRMQTHVGIAFGTNVEHARRVMIDAVRRADFALPDEPVDALYAEIGDSGMIFRVRWWTYFYRDWEQAFDSAHTALRHALAEAGIESPYPSQSLNLQVDDQTLAEVWQAWQGEGGTGSNK